MRAQCRWPCRNRSFSLLGKSILLIGAELLANAIVWIAAVLAFCHEEGLIGLALLAWTIGLRHALDADHISAIDNATRQLMSQGQLPITCGLWFSLGHSTIVIVVNVAIAISVDVYDRLDAVGTIGGVVGTAISASFLFLIAVINIVFLRGAIRERRRAARCKELGLPADVPDPGKIQGGGCLVRIVGPILKAVNRPWKMYPVGVLFGFGFDTASSIALLAISAIAQRGVNNEGLSHVLMTQLLFTTGMSLVDSLDSVLMLYAYASPQLRGRNGKYSIFQDSTFIDPALVPPRDNASPRDESTDEHFNADPSKGTDGIIGEPNELPIAGTATIPLAVPMERQAQVALEAKASTMSSLSISLTVISILLALSISLIEIMGLIDDNCASCQAAANDPAGGGLAGSWWRLWDSANENSGYIGAAIVGVFALILLGYHLGRYYMRKRGSSNTSNSR